LLMHNANTGTAHASAAIEIRSTTKALLVSRMTYAQKNAIPFTTGLIVYQTDAATDPMGGTAAAGLYFSIPFGWVHVNWDYLQPN
jgi:hypothetical protein